MLSLENLPSIWPLIVALVTGGVAWGANRAEVRRLRKDFDDMKAEVKAELNELDSRLYSTESSQNVIITEVRNLKEMVTEMRADVRSILNKQH